MEACLLSFIVGNILANNLPILLNINELLVTMLIIGCVIILRYHKIASVLIGLCSVSAFMQWQILSPIVTNNQPQSLLVEAQIEQLSIDKLVGDKSHQKINVKVLCIYQNDVCSQTFWQPQVKLRLSYYQANPELQLKQLVKLKIKIKPANSFNNEAGFDFKKWLISQSIFATGYVQHVEVLSEDESLKQVWHNKLQKIYLDYPFGDLMLALTTGDRSWIDDNWSALKNTGTAHLLAISGLHIGLIFIWCYWFVLLILLPIRVYRYFAYQTAAKLSALAAIWLFVYFCQHSVSIYRAAIFISIWVAIGIAKVNWSSQQRFVVALSVVLILLPLSPLSISFWLSFTAVASVIIVWRIMQIYALDQHHFLLRIVYLQSGISLLLLPMQVAYFQLIPTSTLLANLIAIPWVSFIILPLLLFAIICLLLAIPFTDLFVRLADGNLAWLFECLAWFETHFAAINTSRVWLVYVAFIPLTILIGCLFRNAAKSKRNLVLIVGTFLPLVTAFYWQVDLKNDGWRVHMLDVGQGLAVLIEDGEQAVLYDTGDKFSSGFNLFEAVVEPVLIARGLTLKKVIVSHSDQDHSGGIDAISKSFPDVTIYNEVNGCKQINQQNWLDLTWFSWQNPSADNSNNASCVVCVIDNRHKVCLTGDIEEVTESWLLQQPSFVKLLPVDVIFVPHHGSRTSSSDAFIKAVKAKYALISRGHFNRFNHPHQQVTDTLSRHHMVILDSAVQGQTKLYFNEFTDFSVNSDLSGFWLPWYRVPLN